MGAVVARGKLTFKESTFDRAVKCARKNGLEIGPVEVRQDGTIIIHPPSGPPIQPVAPESDVNEWNELIEHKENV